MFLRIKCRLNMLITSILYIYRQGLKAYITFDANVSYSPSHLLSLSLSLFLSHTHTHTRTHKAWSAWLINVTTSVYGLFRVNGIPTSEHKVLKEMSVLCRLDADADIICVPRGWDGNRRAKLSEWIYGVVIRGNTLLQVLGSNLGS
jgi:hypothetical protein